MLIKMNKTQLQELYDDVSNKLDQETDPLYREGIQEYLDDIYMEIVEIDLFTERLN